MPPIHILLVDDSPEFLESAKRFLAGDPHIEIVGCVLSARDALEQVRQLHPDLVLMDLAMPEMNGLEATRQIKAQPDAPRVVILTLYDNPEYRAAAEAVRADGFVAKSDFGAQLLPLIHTLFAQPPAPDHEGGVESARSQNSAMIFVSAAPLLSATKSGMVGTAKLT
jgi:DNA-binding NarL/FixJ family response regulator